MHHMHTLHTPNTTPHSPHQTLCTADDVLMLSRQRQRVHRRHSRQLCQAASRQGCCSCSAMLLPLRPWCFPTPTTLASIEDPTGCYPKYSSTDPTPQRLKVVHSLPTIQQLAKTHMRLDLHIAWCLAAGLQYGWIDWGGGLGVLAVQVLPDVSWLHTPDTE
jgi:hypothetical protein